MKITIIGTGYVGLVTGACLAEMGNHVLCLDIDDKKVRLLESGVMPIHEEGLTEVAQRNAAAGRLQYTTDLKRAVAHGTLLFIAVGTSLGVYPVADTVPTALRAGARLIIVNAEQTPFDDDADVVVRGNITEVLPALVAPS